MDVAAEEGPDDEEGQQHRRRDQGRAGDLAAQRQHEQGDHLTDEEAHGHGRPQFGAGTVLVGERVRRAADSCRCLSHPRDEADGCEGGAIR
ncbi:Uncharacterised protein [Mycobacteroides abscessus subsp. abscessus]|nr:Uncharacterised protein [Mycobacteroides abscessus subsp. abscessus]